MIRLDGFFFRMTIGTVKQVAGSERTYPAALINDDKKNHTVSGASSPFIECSESCFRFATSDLKPHTDPIVWRTVCCVIKMSKRWIF